MAWTSLVSSHVGTAQSNTSSSSLSFSTNVALSAGNVLVVAIAKDNAASANGNTSEVTSITDAVGGNTWINAREFCNARGAANGGATSSLWYCKLASDMPSGTSITANFSASTTAKTVVAWAYSTSAGAVLGVAGNAADVASVAANPANQTISGLASREYLFIRALAVERSSFSFTGTTNYTGFGTNTTSGGVDDTNIEVACEFRILTGTGDTVTSNAGAFDTAAVYVALIESTTTAVKSSQVAVEVVNVPTAPKVQSSQIAVEVVNVPNPNLQLQQSALEVISLPTTANVQLSQSVIEVIRANGTEVPANESGLTGSSLSIALGTLTPSVTGTGPTLSTNDSPVFPQAIVNPCVQILPADTTAYKTIRTGSTNGDVIDNIIVTSNDTADRVLLFAINDGTNDHLIGEVAVPALSGRDGNGVVKSICALMTANFPGMHPDGKLYLQSGQVLKVKSEVTVTAAKQIDVVCFGRVY